MATKRKKQAVQPQLDAHSFVRELAKRNQALLVAMVAQIRKGELTIDSSEYADRYIEATVADWCETAEPDLDAHMHMMSVVFYWALLDAAFGNEKQNAAADPMRSGPSAADLAMEAMKTVQAMFGRRIG